MNSGWESTWEVINEELFSLATALSTIGESSNELKNLFNHIDLIMAPGILILVKAL